MAAYTVPNQKVVHINRDMPEKNEGNFLMIKNGNLYAAYRDLNATALCLYLYLAGNMNGFRLALSPKAIHEEMGMPISTVKDQINVLIRKGYLVPKSEGSNVFDFYETPGGEKQAETAPGF
jgi:hypothetical protein